MRRSARSRPATSRGQPQPRRLGAVHTDKAQLLRDQPTAAVQHRSVEELERLLNIHGVEVILDGTAEEVEVEKLAEGS